MNTVTIRTVSRKDFDAIARIYAFEVLNGLATFETEPPSAADLVDRWQTNLAKNLPYLIAEVNGEVAGYAYAGPYRARAAYQNSIENSVYVDNNFRAQGIGKKLLTSLLAECEKGPWRQMVAVIGNSENRASIALHDSLGFRQVGTIEAVGYKLNRWVDTVIMQRALGEGQSTNPTI